MRFVHRAHCAHRGRVYRFDSYSSFLFKCIVIQLVLKWDEKTTTTHKQLNLWPQNRFQNNSCNSKWPLTKITFNGMLLLNVLFCQATEIALDAGMFAAYSRAKSTSTLTLLLLCWCLCTCAVQCTLMAFSMPFGHLKMHCKQHSARMSSPNNATNNPMNCGTLRLFITD